MSANTLWHMMRILYIGVKYDFGVCEHPNIEYTYFMMHIIAV